MEKKYRNRLLLLREWKSVVNRVVEIVKKIYPEAEIYLIGGVAENRITINSDIDVAIVFKSSLSKENKIEILTNLWNLIDNVIPMYYPLEIHILTTQEFARLKGRKVKLS